MGKRSEQQRLNLDIAYELDKYQVMLEYGRLILDRDKAIRDKYRWMSFLKIGCLSGTAIEFLFTVLTAQNDAIGRVSSEIASGCIAISAFISIFAK